MSKAAALPKYAGKPPQNDLVPSVSSAEAENPAWPERGFGRSDWGKL